MANIQVHGEGMRKPVCLVVLGISIVVAAASLGVSLTRYIGLRAYTPGGTPRAAAPAAGRNASAAAAETWNNLFAPGDGMKLASRLPAVNAKTGSQASRSAFVLVGTIVSSTPSARRAILWTSGMKEPKAFREKEEVEPGAILSSIERDKVWIARGNEREKLEILPVGTRTRPTAATAAPVPSTPPPASTPGSPPVPGTAGSPGPSPDRSKALVVAPAPAPGNLYSEDDDENLGAADRRRRVRGNRR